EEDSSWPELGEDLVELARQPDVGHGPDAHDAADRRDARVRPLFDEAVVDGERAEERVDVRVLRIREAQFRRGGQVALPADDRAANPGLNPDVVVPVDAEDQGLHCKVSTGPMIYQAWPAVCKSGVSEEAEALLDPA